MGMRSTYEVTNNDGLAIVSNFHDIGNAIAYRDKFATQCHIREVMQVTHTTQAYVPTTAAELVGLLTHKGTVYVKLNGNVGILQSVQRESGCGRSFNVTLKPLDVGSEPLTTYVRFAL
jgi:hypothetical protein